MEANDYLRSFGMSGLLITEELKEIEQKFKIELGHTPPERQQNATEYYPQFEQQVRIEAASMAQHYELFYCLEQAIRKLITETLEEAAGANWWEAEQFPVRSCKMSSVYGTTKLKMALQAVPTGPSTIQPSGNSLSSLLAIGTCSGRYSRARGPSRR